MWRTSAWTRLALGSGTTTSQSRLRPIVETRLVRRQRVVPTTSVMISWVRPASRASAAEITWVPLTPSSAWWG